MYNFRKLRKITSFGGDVFNDKITKSQADKK